MAKTLEERGVDALEKISESLQTIEDAVLEFDVPAWSERLEWYMNEYYAILKAKVVGNPNRPSRDRDVNES
jgi:hypothetical protein|tara:strand:- start:689 stop:901 length:213 start_codon:yes stop_codon:yes gene_type:complete